MRYFILIALLAVVVFDSCNKKKNVIDSQWQESFTYHESEQIDTMTNTSTGKLLYSIKQTGNNLVFTYGYSKGMNNNIMDDEYTANVIFQVDPNLSTFDYKDGQMKSHLSYYVGGGAWGGYQSTGLESGSISGNRTDPTTWVINIDINLPTKDDNTQLQHIKTTGIYKLTL